MGLRTWYLKEKGFCPQDETRNFPYLVLAWRTQMDGSHGELLGRETSNEFH